MAGDVGSEGAVSFLTERTCIICGFRESFVIALVHDSHARVDDVSDATEFRNCGGILIHQSRFLGALRQALVFRSHTRLDTTTRWMGGGDGRLL